MTAWGSYTFDDIHTMIRSVDAGVLRTLGEKWRGSAAQIGQQAGKLEDETEKLRQAWRSPQAADLFQRKVTDSVARMHEWRQAANTKAGKLTQAASAVSGSQSEMDKLRAQREQELARAKDAAQAEAIRERYDRLARAEGQQLGRVLAGLTPWERPAPYTGVIGLAPKTTGGTITFADTQPFIAPQQEFEPLDRQGLSPVGSPQPVLPVPTIAMPALPGAALAGSALPALGAPTLPTVPAASRVLAGRAFGGAFGGVGRGYVPSGLFGRLAGAGSLPGALPVGAAQAGPAGVPMLPPAAGAPGLLAGRRAKSRRRLGAAPAAPAEPAFEEVAPASEERAGPPAMSGRAPAPGTPARKEVALGQ